MKTVALNEDKDDFSKYLPLAEKEEVIITRHGKPEGILIGFASEDDWFDYRLEQYPRSWRVLSAHGKAFAPGGESSSKTLRYN